MKLVYYVAILVAYTYITGTVFYPPKDVKIFKLIEKNPRKRHTSYPYISGDTFRAIADHIFDETNLPIDTNMVQEGDIVFVIPPYFPYFFTYIYPEIQVPIILVSHNSDYQVPGTFKKYLDDEKIIAWFSINTDMHHPKLHAIPIGLANNYWPHGNTGTIEAGRAKMVEKNYLLYLNFPSITHESRKEIIKLFQHKPFCYVGSNKKYPAWVDDVVRSKFVLSPRGNGIDCHRTWEAMLLGAIPIVPRTTINELYEGLPVLVVEDWHSITQEFLQWQWHIFKETEYAMERMFADYWLDKIRSVQQKYKKQLSKIDIGI